MGILVSFVPPVGNNGAPTISPETSYLQPQRHTVSSCERLYASVTAVRDHMRLLRHPGPI